MKSRFTQIPNFIILDTKITDAEFRTYAVLKSFKYKDGNVFPSQKTLSELRGKSRKSIITHLKKLRFKKHIQYEKRGYSASNQYYFISEDNYTNDEVGMESNDTSNVKETSSLKLQILQPNNNEINNIKTNNIFINKKDKDLGRIRVDEIRVRYPWLNKTKKLTVNLKSEIINSCSGNRWSFLTPSLDRTSPF